MAQKSNLTQINLRFLTMLADNFKELSRLNEHFLVYYQEKADTSLSFFDYFSIGSMVLFAVILLTLGASIIRYTLFRFRQNEACFHFLTMIPHQMLERMREYYSKLREGVIVPGKLNVLEEEEIFSDSEVTKLEVNKHSSYSKIKFINYDKYTRWILVLIIFLVGNGVNYLVNSHIRSFLTPSKMIIHDFNSLMRGENKFI